MKKYKINISAFSIVFSLLFLVAASATKAETQEKTEKNIVSTLNIENTGLAAAGGNSGEAKDRQNPLSKLSAPLKEGVNTFVDFTSPYARFIPNDSRKDYRAVAGFRFRL